jgi:uncharacterized protein YjbI with pentapeptide repeats
MNQKGANERPWWRSLWGWTEMGEKSLWDWLQLLIVPAILSIGAILVPRYYDQQQQELQAQAARQREQDVAYQTYLGQMSRLMLEKDLRGSEQGSEVRTLARARTLTLLERLDADHRTSVLQFLAEANLVQGTGYWEQAKGESKKPAVIDLNGANLHDVSFNNGTLSGAKLSEADLSEAILSDALLDNADLRGANLSGANLNNALLPAADLSCTLEPRTSESASEMKCTNLTGANLSNTFMPGANLNSANLSDANLSGAFLNGADLGSADLSGAELGDDPRTVVALAGADLSYADLSGLNLGNAFLAGADLSYANLEHAKGLDEWTLENQVKSAAGATMPNGKKMPLELPEGGMIEAGEYATDEFEPAFTFEVGEGWEVLKPETADELSIGYRPFPVVVNPEVSDEPSIEPAPQEGHLIVASPLRVLDPGEPSEQKEVPAPESVDEWVSWFQRHPNLETSKPAPVSIRGASGTRIDVTATSTPDNYPRDVCGEKPCVPLYPPSPTVSLEGWKDRFVIVDVEGKVVVMDISAPADKFDVFRQKAQKVLDTVKWEGV